ncbi:MAG: hypothetical protein JSW39_00340 [Desulfobacterales bacterium]|nr:MAG: hypothetical protein JSW39_00340 [Desulfobacterales bacterium]
MKKKTDPRMHTAEHILNQTMDRMFHCGRCFNAHIEKKKSKCDYHFDRSLTPQELEEIQRRVNQIIQADLPVHATFISPGQAHKHYHMGKLPPDVGDRIRIIHIGDYDACPCIGPHVRSTKEISGFQIVSTRFENKTLRIRFKLTA